MRRAINENPLVQIAVLAAMAIALAVVFMIQSAGSGEQAPPSAATAPPAVSAEPFGTEGNPTAGAADPAARTPRAVAVSAGDEGLPAKYARAIDSGETVAIFVVRGKPVSDRLLARYAGRLESTGRAEVFVVKPVRLGDWVRIVGPTGVDRTPALVVVNPGGGQPKATVSYGFRDYESVVQALDDAAYDGPIRAYDPG